MDYGELLNSLDNETVNRLRRALETGRWPDGGALTQEQKESCMQAVIAYDHRHRNEEERVGYIHRPPGHGPKGAAQREPTEKTTQTLNWVDDNEGTSGHKLNSKDERADD